MTSPTALAAVIRNKPLRRGGVVAATVVLALVAWWLAGPVAGSDFTVRTDPNGPAQHVGPAAVAVVALIIGLLAWALLAVLERTTRRARPAWTTIALVALVISLLGPLGGVQTSDKLSLLALHLVVGATLILGLPPRRGAGA
jgi:Family of unknown function (DUF6069)